MRRVAGYRNVIRRDPWHGGGATRIMNLPGTPPLPTVRNGHAAATVTTQAACHGRAGTEVTNEPTPLSIGQAITAVTCCVATTARLLGQRRIHLPAGHIGLRLHFADGTSATVYRQTVVDRPRLADGDLSPDVAHADMIFWAEAATDPVASLLRGVLVPLAAPLLPAVLGWRRLVAAGVRVLAQFPVGYRASPLSSEGAPPPTGTPRAGDRLPDEEVTVRGHRVRLHELLARPGGTYCCTATRRSSLPTCCAPASPYTG